MGGPIWTAGTVHIAATGVLGTSTAPPPPPPADPGFGGKEHPMSNSSMNIDLEPAADAVGDAASSVAGQVGAIADQAREAVGSTMAGLRDGIASAYRSSAARVGAARDCAVDYVRENPVKSVAFAIGLGALTGALLARRR
jgi:ElaB/YqjD/DUF883 family membrane-anchored ribosome-binding protein